MTKVMYRDWMQDYYFGKYVDNYCKAQHFIIIYIFQSILRIQTFVYKKDLSI